MPADHQALSYCGDEVRRYDPDRFLTALYAPGARREALLTLYAFNLEIARVRETAGADWFELSAEQTAAGAQNEEHSWYGEQAIFLR